MENNQQNNTTNNPMHAPLAHYNMPGLNQNPFQYQQRKLKRKISIDYLFELIDFFSTTFTATTITSTIAISTSSSTCCSTTTLSILQVNYIKYFFFLS